MDQYSNNSQNDFLWSLLDNPANDAHLYAHNMQRLVNDFPQSGILQALLAHASEEKNLKQASVYFNPRSLFKLINAPTTFVGVPDERIFIQKGISGNGSYRFDQYAPVYNEPLNEFTGDTIEKSEELRVDPYAPVVEHEAETTTHAIDYEPVFNHETDFYHAVAEHIEEPTALEHAVEEHHVEIPEVFHHEHDAATTDHHEEGFTENISEAASAEVDHELAGHIDHAEKEIYSGIDEAVEHSAIHDELSAIDHHITEDLPENHEPAETTGETEPSEHHHIAEEIPAEEHASAEGLSEHETPAAHHETGEVSAEAHEDIEALPENEASAVHHVVEEVSAEAHESGEGLPEHEAPAGHHEDIEASSETEAPQLHDLAEEIAPEHHEHSEVTHEHETSLVHEPEAEVTDENNELVHAETHEAEPEHQDTEHHAGFSGLAEDALESVTPELETPVISEHINEAEIEKDQPVAVIEHREEDKAREPVTEAPAHEHARPEPKPESGEDETYDEIVGIEDINFGKHSTGDNFFSFDQEFGAHEDEEENKQPVEASAKGASSVGAEADHQDVSKYHDEKMPYSFMWWLDKTRKEHAQAYQPYVKPQPAPPAKKTKKVTDELQQQYFENIFHITSVEELDKTTPPVQAPYNIKRKEQVIIERFIKEEPQIRPQSSDKLDNENKAKKSSEDRDELVTETLAGIYSDQMLYHKAISSYKKLMLRFPEKSRYFADKIEQLEKKTN